MFKIMIFATILFGNDAFDDVAMQLIQDIQAAFNIDWLIVLKTLHSGLELERVTIINLRKSSFTYFSMYSSNDLLSLTTENFTARAPMILYQSNLQLLPHQLEFLHKFKFANRFIWVLLADDNTFKILKKLYIPFNCQFIIGKPLLNNQNFEIIEIYKTSQESATFQNNLGTWSTSFGLNISSANFLQRRMNFHKQKVLVFDDNHRVSGVFGKLKNYLPDIWKCVQNLLNITSVYTANKTHDISIYSTSMLGPSGPDYEYIHVLFTMNIHLFYKELEGQVGWATYTYPFATYVWVMLIIWIIVTSAVMSYVMKKTPKYKSEKSHSELSWRVFDVLAILSQKGVDLITDSSAVKMIGAIHLLCSMMLFGIYSAVFISFITVTIPKIPFDELSLEGILRQGKYNIVVVQDKSYPFFITNQHPTVRALLEKQLPPFEEQAKSFLEAFRKVCFSPHKYLSEYPPASIDELRPQLPGCELSHTSIFLNNFLTTWLVKRDSPYKPSIQLSMLKLSESGVVDGNLVWKKLFLKKKPESILLKSITFMQVKSLFAGLSIGVMLAIFVLVIEIFFSKIKNFLIICCFKSNNTKKIIWSNKNKLIK